MLTSLLTRGMASRLVGKPTANPMIHPPKNLWRKPEVNPVIIAVIVKVMVVSKANVMKNAVNKAEDSLSDFKMVAVLSGERVPGLICAFAYTPSAG